MRLTPKQEAFIDYYIQTGNATEAARLAGYKAKRKSTMRSVGAENLTKLDAQIQARQKELASTRIADATEVLEYLTSVMRREKTETVVVTLSEEQTDFVPGPDGKPHKRTVKRETPKIVEIPARLADANKAAELIGKRLLLWTERAQVGLELPVFLGEDELAD
ncbi:MAG: terminase small subunit [Candidatus Spyradocola sp.]|jgi:phage terminase small subunit